MFMWPFGPLEALVVTKGPAVAKDLGVALREAGDLARTVFPEGPGTQYSQPLVPKTIFSMVFGTRALKCWVLGASGFSELFTSMLNPNAAASYQSQNQNALMLKLIGPAI